jgi:hypothetical protein
VWYLEGCRSGGKLRSPSVTCWWSAVGKGTAYSELPWKQGVGTDK